MADSPVRKYDAGFVYLCRHVARPFVMRCEPDVVMPTPPLPVREVEVNVAQSLKHHVGSVHGADAWGR